MPLPLPEEWTPSLVSPALIRFKNSWEFFIDSLMREWKTLNVVSALLLSAILTMFQIPSAASDPIIRNAALLSLVCALMSLSYGCMYIVKFGTMRSMFRASRWAEEARKSKTSIFWNVWVFLAMPAVWMAWSMICFVFSILAFVWRTGSVIDPEERPPISVEAALGPRIAITTVFLLGLVYCLLILRTLQRYGSHIGVRGIMNAREETEPKSTQWTTEGGDKHAVQNEIKIEERRGREREKRGSGSGSDARERRHKSSKFRSVIGLGLVELDGGDKRQDMIDLEKGLGTE
ncbi:hypothetical protein AMATHDRAFT_155284 [Amanita thiersii Skay4041]|uniref:Uncharacterized protein n=1 Tax=Amanita thiersii Skay4041 TaxID=703135 RepID=A0A2A9N7H6_9AGAR|nr:hypothetical protein AMATHDRAFT_155284 [Amanita thiersii Skay4041]